MPTNKQFNFNRLPNDLKERVIEKTANARSLASLQRTRKWSPRVARKLKKELDPLKDATERVRAFLEWYTSFESVAAFFVSEPQTTTTLKWLYRKPVTTIAIGTYAITKSALTMSNEKKFRNISWHRAITERRAVISLPKIGRVFIRISENLYSRVFPTENIQNRQDQTPLFFDATLYLTPTKSLRISTVFKKQAARGIPLASIDRKVILSPGLDDGTCDAILSELRRKSFPYPSNVKNNRERKKYSNGSVARAVFRSLFPW